MKIIDGSFGEGGGQIFRTALTLAMCKQEPVRIINIRAGRRKPGLLRQHLACLKAAREICSGETIGETLGSSEVTFIPGIVQSGNYQFAVGSAGSTVLIFQTVFIPLAMAGGESYITFDGGTHNGMAPSVDFLRLSFLPLVGKLGFFAEVELKRYGFYPAGGGRWNAKIFPWSGPKSMHLNSFSEVTNSKVLAISAKIPAHITERELAWVRNKGGLPGAVYNQQTVESQGPGNILSLQLGLGSYSVVFETVGERGRSAERVAQLAITDMNRFLDGRVSVCLHLADQLLLPMVLSGGGSFLTNEPTQHFISNAEIIKQFIGKKVEARQLDECRWQGEG